MKKHAKPLSGTFVGLMLLTAMLTTLATASDVISHAVLDSEFKGGIIVFKVEVYENPLTNKLPSEQELANVAEELIGDRGNDDRRKLVRFLLEGMQGESGAYAIAKIEDNMPLEVTRNALSLYGDARYEKYLGEDLEIKD